MKSKSGVCSLKGSVSFTQKENVPVGLWAYSPRHFSHLASAPCVCHLQTWMRKCGSFLGSQLWPAAQPIRSTRKLIQSPSLASWWAGHLVFQEQSFEVDMMNPKNWNSGNARSVGRKPPFHPQHLASCLHGLCGVYSIWEVGWGTFDEVPACNAVQVLFWRKKH